MNPSVSGWSQDEDLITPEATHEKLNNIFKIQTFFLEKNLCHASPP